MIYKTIKSIACASLLVLTVYSLSAQTTGSHSLNVTFPQADYNVNRNLYFYVPTDYDANLAYPLVVGFRGGPHSNAGQFRNQLTFLADSIGAIILCPENSHHFNNQEGLVKKLFEYSVDTAMSIYNIDPDFIYLTGLSYGGRHAVIVAMDTDAGPIPDIRGMIPFAAGVNSEAQPNYEHISDFAPACICIGLADNQSFIAVSRTLQQDIELNGGTSLLNEISGVGHTVAFSTYPDEMMKCLNFIDDQYSAVRVSFDLSTIGISLNPNPVNYLLFINRIENTALEDMYITDLQGAKVIDIAISAVEVNVSDLASGMYFFIAKKDGKLFAEQFIVQR